jgi:hypothetical protein
MKKAMDLHVLSWALAVSAAQRKNLAPLIELLRTDYVPSQLDPPNKESWLRWQSVLAAEREGRLMLAELLSRSIRLVKKRGAQPVPLFKLSAEKSFSRAADVAFKLQHRKPDPMSESDAISTAAALFGISPTEKLARYMKGRGPGFGRRKKKDG